jgi:4-hydroxy-3-methylbut-2-enyl diphosphate reductase IspH
VRAQSLGIRRLVLVAPRGYCAGVERAVKAVGVALARWGPPIHVRRQIVHNRHVVRDLEGRGAIFVESEEDAPVGARLVFSAHGVSPAVRERARARGHATIDATCPLVSAGASAPESLVTRVVSCFRERGVDEIKAQDADAETVSFRVPVELRQSSGRS